MHPYRGWPFLSDSSYPFLSAVWAVLIHGCIALLVVSPIVWRSRRKALWAALAFVGGPALDLDHVVAVGSFNPSRLEHLSGGRPATHSLLFAVVLAMLALLLSRRWVFAWAVFAVVVSHLLFDAAGGSERWLYPAQHPDGIPWLACPVGLVVLTLISELIARRSGTSSRVQPMEDAGVLRQQDARTS